MNEPGFLDGLSLKDIAIIAGLFVLGFGIIWRFLSLREEKPPAAPNSGTAVNPASPDSKSLDLNSPE